MWTSSSSNVDFTLAIWASFCCWIGCWFFMQSITTFVNSLNHQENVENTFAAPDIHYFEGRIDGIIAKEKRGNAGFGYDPRVALHQRDKGTC